MSAVVGAGLVAIVVAVVIFLAIRLRRVDRDVDDYYEREFRDPPNFDGLGKLGGGQFG